MLDIILRILSVIGIVFLALLALLAAASLLVLFFPIGYHVRGSRDGEGFRISVKVKWLFGLFRVQYGYPETGHVAVRALCFTLFDKKIPAGEEPSQVEDSKEKTSRWKAFRRKISQLKVFRRKTSQEKASAEEDTTGSQAGLPVPEGGPDSGGAQKQESVGGTGGDAEDSAAGMADAPAGEPGSDTEETEDGEAEKADADSRSEGEMPPQGKISQKIQKLKYTISGIYDKIKKIWENISYYIGLMQEDETRQLFSHFFFRLGRILRNIRPRHIRAEILFGAGSPDTTGYVYGLYCMISPGLGTEVFVTPDFERAVFRGEFEVSGHITIWVSVLNGTKLLLDKNLRRFLRKVKKERKQKGKVKKDSNRQKGGNQQKG